MQKYIDSLVNSVVGCGLTYKQKFNKKYGFDKNESHSINEISKITKYKKKGLETIFNKGVGAYHTNPESVRPQVHSPEQWAMARIYASINPSSKASKVDKKHLIIGGAINFHKIHWGAFTKQFNNRKNKKLKNLKEFANYILENKNKFDKLTIKRANFYKHIIIGKNIIGCGPKKDLTPEERLLKWQQRNYTNPNSKIVPELNVSITGDNPDVNIINTPEETKTDETKTDETKTDENKPIQELKEIDESLLTEEQIKKLQEKENETLKNRQNLLNTLNMELPDDYNSDDDESVISNNDFLNEYTHENFFYNPSLSLSEQIIPDDLLQIDGDIYDDFIDDDVMENLMLYIENPENAEKYYSKFVADKGLTPTDREREDAILKEGKTEECATSGFGSLPIKEMYNVDECNPNIADFFIEEAHINTCNYLKSLLNPKGDKMFDDAEIDKLKSSASQFGIDIYDNLLKKFLEIKAYHAIDFIKSYNLDITIYNNIKNSIFDINNLEKELKDLEYEDEDIKVILDNYTKNFLTGKEDFKTFFYRNLSDAIHSEPIQIAKFPKPDINYISTNGTNRLNKVKDIKKALVSHNPRYDLEYQKGDIRDIKVPDKQNPSKLEIYYKKIMDKELSKTFKSKKNKAEIIIYYKECPAIYKMSNDIKKRTDVLSVYELGIMRGEKGKKNAVKIPFLEFNVPKIKRDITGQKRGERLASLVDINSMNISYNETRSLEKIDKLDKLIEKEKLKKKPNQEKINEYLEKIDKEIKAEPYSYSRKKQIDEKRLITNENKLKDFIKVKTELDIYRPKISITQERLDELNKNEEINKKEKKKLKNALKYEEDNKNRPEKVKDIKNKLDKVRNELKTLDDYNTATKYISEKQSKKKHKYHFR
jgi:hypothetical protein